MYAVVVVALTERCRQEWSAGWWAVCQSQREKHLAFGEVVAASRRASLLVCRAADSLLAAGSLCSDDAPLARCLPLARCAARHRSSSQSGKAASPSRARRSPFAAGSLRRSPLRRLLRRRLLVAARRGNGLRTLHSPVVAFQIFAMRLCDAVSIEASSAENAAETVHGHFEGSSAREPSLAHLLLARLISSSLALSVCREVPPK